MKKLLLLFFCLTSCTETDFNDQVAPYSAYCYRHVSGNDICARTMRLCEEAESHVENENDIVYSCRQIYYRKS
jgi:hypothetical protein